MAALLSGIRVVEMANVITGPYAGMLLSDLGADVIKVELPRTGDTFRKWGSKAASSSFAALNRGKRSVTVDVKTPDGGELYRKLCETADAVVENFRPGVLDKYDVGHSSLSVRKPNLVYCKITGVGEDGPLRDRPVFDSVVEGLSGLWSQLLDESEPKPIGLAFADHITGVYSALGVLAGLAHTMRTGRGVYVSSSMLGCTMAFQSISMANYLINGEVEDRFSRPRKSLSFALVSSDSKPLAIHLSSPSKFWISLTECLQVEHLQSDMRFIDANSRIQNYWALYSELTERIRSRPRDEWLELLAAHDVPAAPINDVAEALDHPQFKSLGILESFGNGADMIELIGSPLVAHGDERNGPRPATPQLGEHNREVFGSLGCDETTLNGYQASGII